MSPPVTDTPPYPRDVTVPQTQCTHSSGLQPRGGLKAPDDPACMQPPLSSEKAMAGTRPTRRAGLTHPELLRCGPSARNPPPRPSGGRVPFCRVCALDSFPRFTWKPPPRVGVLPAPRTQRLVSSRSGPTWVKNHREDAVTHTDPAMTCPRPPQGGWGHLLSTMLYCTPSPEPQQRQGDTPGQPLMPHSLASPPTAPVL